MNGVRRREPASISRETEEFVIVSAVAVMALMNIFYFTVDQMPDALYMSIFIDALLIIIIVWSEYSYSKIRRDNPAWAARRPSTKVEIGILVAMGAALMIFDMVFYFWSDVTSATWISVIVIEAVFIAVFARTAYCISKGSRIFTQGSENGDR